MNIEMGYQSSFTNWTVTKVFENYHSFCEQNYKHINFSYLQFNDLYDNNPSGIYSPHLMTIKNLDNGKYIIVSYWDNAVELTWNDCGWDNENCVGLVTSSGVFNGLSHTPFSYLPYSSLFTELSKNAKSMDLKENNELSFRGHLYGDRLDLANIGKIKITADKIFPEDLYFDELTNNKICLSLNGAGEICNRDIEILAAKSVLLRPMLLQKFHNELIPDHHYIGFEFDADPSIQSDIILDVFEKSKNDHELLKCISENGYEWYQKNGTIDSNVDILSKIINFSILK